MERDDTFDYFFYPHEDDNGSIVDNSILPLTTPDKWRHELASVCHVGELIVRVVFKECLFPGRCFDCKLNLKSVCFCFWGQHVRNSRMDEALDETLVERLEAWKQYRIGNDEDVTTPLSVFPDMDVMFPASSPNRIPQQHMIPPLKPLLLQEPFRSVVPQKAFHAFLRTRQTLEIRCTGRGSNKSAKFLWIESTERLQLRIDVLSIIPTLADEEARGTVQELLANMYMEWNDAVCQSSCDKRKKDCHRCRTLSRVLKKKFKEGVRQSVTDNTTARLLAKKHPFQNVPKINADFQEYEDDVCRVSRIIIFDPKPRAGAAKLNLDFKKLAEQEATDAARRATADPLPFRAGVWRGD